MVSSVIFLVLAALFIFLGVLKGKKYTWVYSAMRIVCAVISAILSMLFASLLGSLLGGLLSDAVASALGARFPEIPAFAFAAKALLGMLVAPILFWIVFPIVYNLLNLLLPLLSKLLCKVIPQKVTGVCDVTEEDEETPKKKRKHKRKAALRAKGANPAGMVCGGVCALLLFCIALVPAVGLADTGVDIVSVAVTFIGEDKLPSGFSESLARENNNVGSVVVRTVGGRALYRGMTTYRGDGVTVRLSDEIDLLAAIGDAKAAHANKELSRADAANAVREIIPAMENATLIPKVGADLLDAGADAWTKGEKYQGLVMPSPAGYGELFRAIVSSQKGATPDTFREDMGTIISIVAHLVEKDAIGQVRGDAMSLLSDSELTEGILYELLESPRLYVTVGSALDVGVDKIGTSLEMKKSRDTLYEDFCDEIRAVARPSADSAEEQASAAKQYQQILEAYGLEAEDVVINAAGMAAAQVNTDMVAWLETAGVVSAKTMSQKSVLVTSSELEIAPVAVQNKREEATLLSQALSTISAVADKADAPDMDVADMVVDFGPAFDLLAKTETVGREKSAKIFKATLQSKKVSEQIGFSVLEAAEIADTINVNAHRTSYAQQMLSLSQTVRVIRNSGTAEAESAIEALLADLTPESASTLQAISTPSVVMNHGVPERSAGPVSTMMSDMFGNLSEANLNDEQRQRETAAVNNVMTMAMNAGNSNGASFGEGSVTGTSAEQFVNDIMDSEVVSQTVMEQVYGDGSEPQNDPLVTERAMSEADEAELITALNNKWQNATDEQRADENFKRKLISTAALMNVAVTVTDSGVVKAA